jgi:hypothetical protein
MKKSELTMAHVSHVRVHVADAGVWVVSWVHSMRTCGYKADPYPIKNWT